MALRERLDTQRTDVDPWLEIDADGHQHSRPSGRGRLASPRYHRFLRLGRGQADEPCGKGITDKDFELAKKIEEAVAVAAGRAKAARWKARHRPTSASPTSNTIDRSRQSFSYSGKTRGSRPNGFRSITRPAPESSIADGGCLIGNREDFCWSAQSGMPPRCCIRAGAHVFSFDIRHSWHPRGDRLRR